MSSVVTLSKKQELSDKPLYVPSAMFTVRAQCGLVVGWSVISIGDGELTLCGLVRRRQG